MNIFFFSEFYCRKQLVLCFLIKQQDHLLGFVNIFHINDISVLRHFAVGECFFGFFKRFFHFDQLIFDLSDTDRCLDLHHTFALFCNIIEL